MIDLATLFLQSDLYYRTHMAKTIPSKESAMDSLSTQVMEGAYLGVGETLFYLRTLCCTSVDDDIEAGSMLSVLGDDVMIVDVCWGPGMAGTWLSFDAAVQYLESGHWSVVEYDGYVLVSIGTISRCGQHASSSL